MTCKYKLLGCQFIDCDQDQLIEHQNSCEYKILIEIYLSETKIPISSPVTSGFHTPQTAIHTQINYKEELLIQLKDEIQQLKEENRSLINSLSTVSNLLQQKSLEADTLQSQQKQILQQNNNDLEQNMPELQLTSTNQYFTNIRNQPLNYNQILQESNLRKEKARLQFSALQQTSTQIRNKQIQFK
ncbi:hypothetical protein SS50377_23604 [Spironucleus salmonicida]|uniref:Uncharacterized protein n=1 Tax=Spironucleus salmonicida TaxID=348837 RepID=V6LXZ2_9EUKA|nr:hypothetical protein SS50377_23604 [Spironucleus salmonicida]|eukprot:EST48586.1 Hypothetical protein SS50377_11197 [Spironucleus salmonicida]